MTGILAELVAVAMQINDGATLGMSFLIGFIVGYGMCDTLFLVVSSAVNAVIVCYADAPSEFQMNHPELAAEMRASWSQAWPGLVD